MEPYQISMITMVPFNLLYLLTFSYMESENRNIEGGDDQNNLVLLFLLIFITETPNDFQYS